VEEQPFDGRDGDDEERAAQASMDVLFQTYKQELLPQFNDLISHHKMIFLFSMNYCNLRKVSSISAPRQDLIK
jgi:hypothetical protein